MNWEKVNRKMGRFIAETMEANDDFYTKHGDELELEDDSDEVDIDAMLMFMCTSDGVFHMKVKDGEFNQLPSGAAWALIAKCMDQLYRSGAFRDSDEEEGEEEE